MFILVTLILFTVFANLETEKSRLHLCKFLALQAKLLQCTKKPVFHALLAIP